MDGRTYTVEEVQKARFVIDGRECRVDLVRGPATADFDDADWPAMLAEARSSVITAAGGDGNSGIAMLIDQRVFSAAAWLVGHYGFEYA